MNLQMDGPPQRRTEVVEVSVEVAARPVLESTWAAVRGAVEELPVGWPERASVLPGWTVGDVVAHLGRGLDVLAGCTAAGAEVAPLSLRAYLRRCAQNAAQIGELTRALRIATRGDPLAALDAAWRRAVAVLDGLGPSDRVVRAGRGPLMLGDLLASRVLELVVHADDISSSIPERPPLRVPVPAVTLTGKVLLAAFTEACPGDAVELDVSDLGVTRLGPAGGAPGLVRTDRLTWIRLACGRLSWPEAVRRHQLSVQPALPSPDLSAALPLV